MSERNGGNPRLDRIERMIEGLAKAQVQHSRELAEHRVEFKRELAEHRAEVDRELAASRAKQDRDSRKFRDDLRGWAALGVKEARNQRKRRQEIDLYITRLAAAQVVTEERLGRFIASLERGRNGGRKSE
jgi:hypothetical protein